MTIALWRIAVEAPGHSANDLTGAGAKNTGGRWNSKGRPMLYCSSSIALATLETLAYLGAGTLPYNRYLVRIDVPDSIWAERKELAPVPVGWDAVPSGTASKKAGNAWLTGLSSALLLVPSVIVPDEFNILINPVHPDARLLSSVTVKRWIFDPRFF